MKEAAYKHASEKNFTIRDNKINIYVNFHSIFLTFIHDLLLNKSLSYLITFEDIYHTLKMYDLNF